MALSEEEKELIRRAGGNPAGFKTYQEFIRRVTGAPNRVNQAGGPRPEPTSRGTGLMDPNTGRQGGIRPPAAGGSSGGSSAGLEVLDGLQPIIITQLEQLATVNGMNPNSAAGRAFMAEQAIAMGFVDTEEADFIGHLGPRRAGPLMPSVFGPGSLDTEPYVVGNEFDELADLSTEDLRRWQEKMVTLGFMDPDSVIYGKRDSVTIEAMGGLLSMANAEGVGWGTLLRELEGMAGEDGSLFDNAEDARKFTAPGYLAPDYATMAQKVKETMRSTLGRDPDESEMAVLVSELQGWDRQAFDAEVQSARGEFEAQEAGAATSPDTQGVDPIARFNEFFQQKYSEEIDFVEERDEQTPVAQASIGAGVDTLSQMSRGGA